LANDKLVKTLSCGLLEQGEAAIFIDVPIGPLPEGNQQIQVIADPGAVTGDFDLHNNRSVLSIEVVGRDRANTIEMSVGSPKFRLNGSESYMQSTDTSPIIINSRVMVPIKTIAESLGGFAVWNDEKRQITVRIKGHEAILSVGEYEFAVDSKRYRLDTAPQVIAGRTYIPIRGVMEALGAEVYWDGSAKSVTIRY
jgi:hypothetical protein